MRVGLIDVDGHNYPNLPLMKLSAWHKSQGDIVEWYDLMNATIHHVSTGKNLYDKVYMSKVFSFTSDYQEIIYANEIERGGSGYCISLVNGKEVYDKSKDKNLPYEIEHIYPDYSLYPEQTGYGKPLKEQKCYGFLSRGCPRGCDFCHVKNKEGQHAYKVANLSEFWKGQGTIVLCDPNLIAVKEWKELLQQLIDSKSYVDINQGIDIRMMTDEKAQMIKQLKIKSIHFAWDRYEDKDIVIPKFRKFKEITGLDCRKLIVYVLTNFNTTTEQDLERIYTLRELGYDPYVMIYDKEHTKPSDDCRKMQRWVNNRLLWRNLNHFDEYDSSKRKKKGDIF